MRIVLAEDEALLREGLGLLLERAGHDVGTERALHALSRNVVPSESAAQLQVVETPTEPFSVLDDPEDEEQPDAEPF